jgi:flavin-binding protein dodecin
MSVARVTEISAGSTKSFEDAIAIAVARANQTLRNVRSAWVKEQHVIVANGKVAEFRVNVLVTFVLEEAPASARAARKPRAATPRRRAAR